LVERWGRRDVGSGRAGKDRILLLRRVRSDDIHADDEKAA
jgi:hypothetical protein